jgi:quinol-cytochrome oxidoreductase complex cytochrome b subunit
MFDKHPHWRKLLILPPIVLGLLVLMFMASHKQGPQKVESGEPTKLVRIVEARQLELIPKKQDSHRMNITTIAYLFECYRYPYREIKAYS